MHSTKKLLHLARTITTLKPKCAPTASPASPLLLNSYFEADPHDGVYYKNREIDDLIKVGHLNYAIEMFDKMALRDVVTYNLLISGCGRYGLSELALQLYAQMVAHELKETGSTFSSVLGICSDMGYFREGIQVHCRVVSLGFNLSLFVGSALVNLFLQMGFDEVALRLFDELPDRNLAIWNLMLRGICEQGGPEDVLSFYNEMQYEGLEPNGLTFCYMIRGCANKRLLDEGRKFHCEALKVGYTESNVFVTNSLVDFYSNCGSLIDAKKAYEVIPVNDVISWNSIVAVHAENGLLLDTLSLFSLMQFWDKKPSIRSFIGILNLSCRIKNIQLGKQVHSCVLKLGFDYNSFHIQSALINMYGKCGDIESSVAVYESVIPRTLECCNSLITSLLHCGVTEDVVEMFGLMVDEGFGYDEVTLSTTLKALSSVSTLSSLASFRLLQCFAIKSGFDSHLSVSCSLIDAYSRCGHMELSRQVFQELKSPNLICFTSIINGYARNGMGRECVEMLQEIIKIGLVPDKVTFLCALMGCNHSGLVREGRYVFDLMESRYEIRPDREHYSCMVDLLSRLGFLNEAEELLKRTSVKGDCVIWSLILRSCRVHGNETVGRRVVKILMDLEPDDPAICLQASLFYSEIGDFETSMRIREIAMAKKMTKEIGQSFIEATSLRQDS